MPGDTRRQQRSLPAAASAESAARMTPGVLPMPPRMTMTTMSMDFMKPNPLGREKLFRVRVKSAGDAREKRADDKRGDLVLRRVDAHRLGGDFVVAHGDEAAAVGRMHQRGDDINRHGREAEHPKEIRVAMHHAQTARAADGVHVLKNDADDFAEAERDDGQIIAPQPQRRQSRPAIRPPPRPVRRPAARQKNSAPGRKPDSAPPNWLVMTAAV